MKQAFKYNRLEIKTGKITEHSYNAIDLLGFLKQINKWNSEKLGCWVYWYIEK